MYSGLDLVNWTGLQSSLVIGKGIPLGLEGFWGVWKDYYSVILELVQMLCVMDQKLPKDHCLTLSKGWDK